LQILSSLSNLGMAVTIDIGNPTNVHPAAKQEVGRRLSLWARAKNYGETSLVHSGPLFNGSFTDEGATFRVGFDHVGGGLQAQGGGALTGFEVAGEDGNWQAATATIQGNEIIISGASVPDPQAVRYAWAPNPVMNLINADNLPASPFRAGDLNFIIPPPDLPKKISSAFPHYYEANGYLPDAETCQTWMNSFGTGTFTAGPSTLSFSTPLSGGQDFRQDNNSSYDWYNEIGSTTSWTVEFSVKVTAGSGDNPGMILWMGQETTLRSGYIVVGSNLTRWGYTSSPNKQTLDTNDNSDRQHVFRVAYDGVNDKYHVWRDGVKIGTDLGAGLTGFSQNWMIIIDSGSNVSSTGELDYIRWDATGAYAQPKCDATYKADFNKDCYVDLLDLIIFVSQWLECTDPYYSEKCSKYVINSGFYT
jgi:hypothetical protein